MNLHSLLRKRAEDRNPVRVGVIGAGKFSSMFLSQAARTPGMHVVGIAELDPAKAVDACRTVGWPDDAVQTADTASAVNDAARRGKTGITGDAAAVIDSDAEVIVEITGNPEAGAVHAVRAIENGKHLVMPNVETDCLIGPLLADKAHRAGVVYSMAYGDQPALIMEQIDWARTAGFDVTAAGKGTRFQPQYHYSTPETVWGYYGFTEDMVADGRYNAQMFNSFLDGTKSAIEMCAVANAAGLNAAPGGLKFPPVSVHHLQDVLVPEYDGGILPRAGMVECVASEDRFGVPVHDDLRWGVYVVIAAGDDYVRRCFKEYGLKTDRTGRYAALYRPYHFIGLELGLSVASAALRREPTGVSRYFQADVAATAKNITRPGAVLDGEGGFTVYGALIPAADSLQRRVLPMGLTAGAEVIRPLKKDQIITLDDVNINQDSVAANLRRELEDAARDGRFQPPRDSSA